MATLCATFSITDYFMDDRNGDIYLAKVTWGEGEIWRKQNGSYTFDFVTAGDHLTLEELSKALRGEEPFMAQCISEMNLDGHKYHGATNITTVLKNLMCQPKGEE